MEHYFPRRTVKFHAEDEPVITDKTKNLIIQQTNKSLDHYTTKRDIKTHLHEIKKEKKSIYGEEIRPIRSNIKYRGAMQ